MIAETIGQIDQPADQKHRRRDEEEARRPPAAAAGRRCRPPAPASRSRATFGATLRYQPSLIATSQSPPGKTGIVVGITSLYFSRSSGETWSQETPGKPPSSVRTAFWISSVRMKSASFSAASLLTPFASTTLREKPPGRPRSVSWTRPVVSGSTPWAIAWIAWSDQAGIMVTARLAEELERLGVARGVGALVEQRGREVREHLPGRRERRLGELGGEVVDGERWPGPCRSPRRWRGGRSCRPSRPCRGGCR